MIMEPAYFDQMYADADDPWGFTSRWYEKRKYALTLALLPRERYDDAFEPGCSIGIMTEQLARRCTRVLACDVAAAAVKATAARVSGQPGVRVQQRVLPDEWPDGDFDLIVLSEFLYYFGGPDLQHVLDLAEAALRPGGSLIAVHWRHPVTEYPRSGDEVHDMLAGRAGLSRLADHREPDFIAEAYLKGPLVSVAQATGLA
ncbi:MAG TPA: SAM-dependent methyltransferase [Streptosporangiaceae bacterium]|jgi:SAM-dependent methyltransferase|nr:SAM-dependent methyltransferase [Streptosporangiaceae bacterium]